MSEKRYQIREGRNVTLKMGTGHPGYVFGLAELASEQPEEVIEQLLKDKVVEDVSPKPEPEVKPEPEQNKKSFSGAKRK